MSLEEAWDKLRQRAHQPLTEVHVVNGLHPGSAVRLLPGDAARLQAHSSRHPSEVFHRRRDRVLLRSLRHDRRAGAARAARGRPRLAARRRRGRCSRSACAGRSATTSAAPIATSTSTASRTGSACDRTSRCSTATSRRWRSASITCCGRARCRTRPAACRRSSRWRSIPTTTRCGSCRRRPASDTLRVHAVSRLMLDNIPHMKAYWIATGVEVAQMALWFGADDLDGTVQEEKIYHMAGARTPESMTHVRDPPADPRRRPRARRARHALQRRDRPEAPDGRWSRRSQSRVISLSR